MHSSVDYFEQQDKHLVIFDFDETLCLTDAKVTVHDLETDFTQRFSPTEYSAWRETKAYEKHPARWEMDFSSFRGYPVGGVPNESVLNALRFYANKDQYIVALVTGRDNLFGPKQFLKEFYVPVNKMMLMCSGSPDKRNCFRSLIQTFEPKHITIYEDSIQYIEQCLEISSEADIPFSGVLVNRSEIIYDWRNND